MFYVPAACRQPAGSLTGTNITPPVYYVDNKNPSLVALGKNEVVQEKGKQIHKPFGSKKAQASGQEQEGSRPPSNHTPDIFIPFITLFLFFLGRVTETSQEQNTHKNRKHPCWNHLFLCNALTILICWLLYFCLMIY